MIFDRTPDGIKPFREQPCVSGYTGDAMKKAAKLGILHASRKADVRGAGKWLKNEADWRWFCKSIGEGYVRRFATAVCSAYTLSQPLHYGDKFYRIPCEDCGSLIHPMEIYHWSYKGNGGIGINWCGLLCDACLREKHLEYVADAWKTMGEPARLDAWEKSEAENPWCTPAWEAVRDSEELPLDPIYV